MMLDDPYELGALHTLRPGILRAYAADDIARRLWTSDDDGERDTLGTFAKFNPPTVANGRVYMVATIDDKKKTDDKNENKLVVYGLLNHHYLRPGEIPPEQKALWWFETLAPLHRD